MKQFALLCVAALMLAACSNSYSERVAEFWRPISEPNTRLPLNDAQLKLEYDLSQCNCANFPKTMPKNLAMQFEPADQRMIETGLTTTLNDKAQCVREPGYVMTECMRARGWEITKCSGRMPVASGGAVCSAYVF